MSKIFYPFFLVFPLILGLTSCNVTADQSNLSELDDAAIEKLSKQDTIKVDVLTGDQMKFNLNEIDVWAGQVVELTLHHQGTMSKQEMGHNLVIIDNKEKTSDFAREASQEMLNDYVPKDGKGMIAHTEMIGGGQKSTVIFNAPAKGDYDFICSFPGHFQTMSGIFRVK